MSKYKEPAYMCPAIDQIIDWVYDSDIKEKDKEKIKRGMERLRDRITKLRVYAIDQRIMKDDERYKNDILRMELRNKK